MAQWRVQALRIFPQFKKLIDSSKTIMLFWGELWFEFARAYHANPRDEATILATYQFADWCVQAPDNDDVARDPSSATVVCFYEHIPHFKPARDDMPRWFRYSEVAQSREIFSYLIEEAEFESLLEYMRENQHRYRPRTPVG